MWTGSTWITFLEPVLLRLNLIASNDSESVAKLVISRANGTSLSSCSFALPIDNSVWTLKQDDNKLIIIHNSDENSSKLMLEMENRADIDLFTSRLRHYSLQAHQNTSTCLNEWMKEPNTSRLNDSSLDESYTVSVNESSTFDGHLPSTTNLSSSAYYPNSSTNPLLPYLPLMTTILPTTNTAIVDSTRHSLPLASTPPPQYFRTSVRTEHLLPGLFDPNQPHIFDNARFFSLDPHALLHSVNDGDDLDQFEDTMDPTFETADIYSSSNEIQGHSMEEFDFGTIRRQSAHPTVFVTEPQSQVNLSSYNSVLSGVWANWEEMTATERTDFELED